MTTKLKKRAAYWKLSMKPLTIIMTVAHSLKNKYKSMMPYVYRLSLPKSPKSLFI